MLKVRIDNRDFLISSQYSILEACKFVGVIIPRFCYHEKLSIAGNCRMCLVEVDKSPKPVASCATPLSNLMEICTRSPFVQKAREGVLEFLLLHHPLDCPICDQAGECDLQDQYLLFGAKHGRYFFEKRAVEDKVFTPVIKTIMTRCIHCTRCIRFFSEICGVPVLGTLNRGLSTEVGAYIKPLFNSELSGNVVDLCPVGALTTRFSSFRARPWELRVFESFDLTDSSGSPLVFHLVEQSVGRVLPKKNREVSTSWISDKMRFCYDAFSVLNTSSAFTLLPLLSTFFQQNIHIILTKNSNCLNFRLLKHLTYLRKNFFYVAASIFTTNSSYSNFYKNTEFSSTVQLGDITEAAVGFLFSCNLQVEVALFNAKIRSIILRKGISIFSFHSLGVSALSFCTSTVDSFFMFLKHKNNALMFFNKYTFLVIAGFSLCARLTTYSFLFSSLKIQHRKISLYFAHTMANSILQSYYNFAPTNSHLLKNSYTFFLEGDDSVQSRTIKVNNRANLCVLTGNSPLFASWLNPHLSIQNTFEHGGTFFTMEQRSFNALPLVLESTLLHTSITFFLQSFKTLLLAKDASFVQENSLDTEENLFLDYSLLSPTRSASLIPFLSIGSQVPYITFSTRFSSYPLKSQLTDFYQTDLLVKNSEQLRLCSRGNRKVSSF